MSIRAGSSSIASSTRWRSGTTRGTEPAPEPEPPAPAAAIADTSSPAKSPDERKAILDRRLSEAGGAQGWRIENRSDFQATVAHGKPIHHVLHLILTILTAGLWLIVWICLAIFGGVKRRLLSVDDYGNIIDQKI